MRNQEPFPIENIGTILDRVPKYANFEQIFSAGFDEIISSGRNDSRFKYTIADIPKSLIKVCKTHDVKISNKFLEYYKKNPDAHFLAYNLKYVSLNDKDIWNILSTEYSIRGEDYTYNYYSYFNSLLDDYGYNAKALLLYIDKLKTYEALEDCSYIIREIFDYMLEDEEYDEQCIMDTLESVGYEIEDKADGYAKIIKSLESDIEGISTEINRLTARKKTYENRIKWLKQNLEMCMRATGKRKFTTDLFSFMIQKNGGKRKLVIDVEIDNVPKKYRIKQPDAIDGESIREYLKENGYEGKDGSLNCEFAHLEPQGESLRIR